MTTLFDVASQSLSLFGIKKRVGLDRQAILGSKTSQGLYPISKSIVPFGDGTSESSGGGITNGKELLRARGPDVLRKQSKKTSH